MRTFFVLPFVVVFAWAASAATLEVEVSRHGFAGPIKLAVAPRTGRAPEWSATKTLPSGKSSASFEGLAAGLYVVMARGPQPLQRLSARANLDAKGAVVHLAIPRSKTELRVTLAGQPLPHAPVLLTHNELRWETAIETGRDGRFKGELWEPGVYAAAVRRTPTTSAHVVDVWLAPKPVMIDVPDRHVAGRVLAGGLPLPGAILQLRSETNDSVLTVRTHSAADGRFEFFGVHEGALILTARAVSYLDSDAIAFDLRGSPARHSVDVELVRGEPRAVRVVDPYDAPITGATLIASCGGHVKSMSITNDEGRADVPLPAGSSACEIYVLPKDRSIAVKAVSDAAPLLIRVRAATSSLRLALKTEEGTVFSAMSLLMRIDGLIVPPAVARLLGSRGFPLVTNEEGSISLPHIPPGTYDFWPYRTAAEGQLLYETVAEFDAPISVKVLTGENNATVKFAAK